MKTKITITISGGYFSKAELTALAKNASRGHGTAYCFLIGILDKIWEETRPTKPLTPRKLSKRALQKKVRDELVNRGRYPIILWNSFCKALSEARHAR